MGPWDWHWHWYWRRHWWLAPDGAGSGARLGSRSESGAPPGNRHPERQRRILVHGVSETDAGKYQSAGESPEEMENEGWRPLKIWGAIFVGAPFRLAGARHPPPRAGVGK